MLFEGLVMFKSNLNINEIFLFASIIGKLEFVLGKS